MINLFESVVTRKALLLTFCHLINLQNLHKVCASLYLGQIVDFEHSTQGNIDFFRDVPYIFECDYRKWVYNSFKLEVKFQKKS